MQFQVDLGFPAEAGWQLVGMDITLSGGPQFLLSEVDHRQPCRVGSSASCAGKSLDGTIDQSDQTFFDNDQMNDGYGTLCAQSQEFGILMVVLPLCLSLF